jgi:membrane associated rhomboid family serine protease
MGIHDRDYIRNQPPPGGGPGRGFLSGMRMWSVNTWLIVICVAVFFIDGFLPPQLHLIGTTLDPRFQNVDLEALQEGPQQHLGGDRYRTLLFAPTVPNVPAGENQYRKMQFIEGYMHFSTARAFLIRKTSRGLLGLEFWRFIGFQFLHGSLMHLIFNMIGLYFFGPLVERRLGSKRYLAFYLLCGIFGALMYLLLNLGGVAAASMMGANVRIPGLLFNDVSTPLIGASAGVFGVLMAGAYIVPNATVLLFLILPMRLATLAYALVAIALFSVIVGRANAGGEAGHLGGAIAGFYFIRHPQHLHGFFDFVGWADPTSHHYRHKKPRAGPGAGSGPGPGSGSGRRPPADRAEVDRILDKISDTGLHSLSEKEKRILREASNR